MKPVALALTLTALVACAPETQTKPDPVDEPALLEDSEEEVVDDNPNLPDGSADRFAQKACDLLTEGGTTVIAAASVDEAGQTIILPSDDGEVLAIELPETGAGYMTIEIPDWMTTVRIFTNDLAPYDIPEGEDLTGLRKNGSCPDERISDARWAFHEWGSYLFEWDETSPRTVWFVALKEG